MYNTQQTARKSHSGADQPCLSYTAYFRLTQDKRVCVFFPKRKLPLEVRQRYFGKGQFEMPSAFDLPAIVLLKLGLEAYQINSGLYPVQENHDFIRIDF